jgi:hypothetical protein
MSGRRAGSDSYTETNFAARRFIGGLPPMPEPSFVVGPLVLGSDVRRQVNVSATWPFHPGYFPARWSECTFPASPASERDARVGACGCRSAHRPPPACDPPRLPITDAPAALGRVRGAASCVRVPSVAGGAPPLMNDQGGAERG